MSKQPVAARHTARARASAGGRWGWGPSAIKKSRQDASPSGPLLLDTRRERERALADAGGGAPAQSRKEDRTLLQAARCCEPPARAKRGLAGAGGGAPAQTKKRE